MQEAPEREGERQRERGRASFLLSRGVSYYIVPTAFIKNLKFHPGNTGLQPGTGTRRFCDTREPSCTGGHVEKGEKEKREEKRINKTVDETST